MEAVCASDVKWHKGLVPLVRDIVKNQLAEDNSAGPSFDTRKGLTFLTRTGHRDEVVAIIKASSWKNKSKHLQCNFATEKPGFGKRKDVCG